MPTDRSPRPPLTPAEQARRDLLKESDHLLDEVEELRLEDRQKVPEPLRTRIERLQLRAGRGEASIAPATLRSAHELVLSVQYRLMTRNPHNRATGIHLGRGAGQATVHAIAGGGSWKHLVLPPVPAVQTPEWRDLVDGTVDRALDRWAYCQHHAARAARDRSGARQALARALVAWANYWDLREEAERLLGQPA
jgi:hypothetical protein